MTEKECEELIEKMAERINEMRLFLSTNTETARAALAVAEPVIREQAYNVLREENSRLREQNTELLLRAHALLWLLPPEITCGELQKARDEMLAATIREGKKDEN